jgi:hypothetical protein
MAGSLSSLMAPMTFSGGIAGKAVRQGPRCHSIVTIAGVFLYFACHRFIAAASGPFRGHHAFINTEQRVRLDVMASTSGRYSHAIAAALTLSGISSIPTKSWSRKTAKNR